MKIALLTGWTWLERDVALRSANTFHENMKYEHDMYVLPDEMDAFLSHYKEYEFAVPVFHGQYGEDGMIFGLLDSLGLKSTFSPFATHALCMDKNKTNILVEKIWIQVPKSYLISNKKELQDTVFCFPLIVKPNSGWSSVATYMVNDMAELERAFDDVREITKDIVLVQQFITWVEYSVPIIGNDDLEALPIMRVALTSGKFFDYEEKYNSDGTNEIFWDVEPNLQKHLEEDSKKIYHFLGCRWISRIDYIVNDTGRYFLEVNTIPGFSPASIFPKAWQLTGRSLEEIVEKIIELGRML